MDPGRCIACIENFEKFRKFSYKRFAHKSARYLSRYSKQRPMPGKALADASRLSQKLHVSRYLLQRYLLGAS